MRQPKENTEKEKVWEDSWIRELIKIVNQNKIGNGQVVKKKRKVHSWMIKKKQKKRKNF